MTTPLHKKSTIDEIRQRFDDDVERFSNLETGQSATIDAPLAMEVITEAAIAAHPAPIRRVLDVGCGAGNNSLKIRQAAGYNIDFDLLDISQPMLKRAAQRIKEINQGSIRQIQDDLIVPSRAATNESGKVQSSICPSQIRQPSPVSHRQSTRMRSS